MGATPQVLQLDDQQEQLDLVLGSQIVHQMINNYEELENLPELNGVQIIGQKTLEDYGIQGIIPVITQAEIDEIIEGL